MSALVLALRGGALVRVIPGRAREGAEVRGLGGAHLGIDRLLHHVILGDLA